MKLFVHFPKARCL